MIINVTVAKKSDGPGYRAVAEGLPICWEDGDTMDETINNFKKSYGSFIEMQFANGEKIEFDFHVIL